MFLNRVHTEIFIHFVLLEIMWPKCFMMSVADLTVYSKIKPIKHLINFLAFFS